GDRSTHLDRDKLVSCAVEDEYRTPDPLDVLQIVQPQPDQKPRHDTIVTCRHSPRARERRLQDQSRDLLCDCGVRRDRAAERAAVHVDAMTIDLGTLQYLLVCEGGRPTSR